MNNLFQLYSNEIRNVSREHRLMERVLRYTPLVWLPSAGSDLHDAYDATQQNMQGVWCETLSFLKEWWFERALLASSREGFRTIWKCWQFQKQTTWKSNLKYHMIFKLARLQVKIECFLQWHFKDCVFWGSHWISGRRRRWVTEASTKGIWGPPT